MKRGLFSGLARAGEAVLRARNDSSRNPEVAAGAVRGRLALDPSLTVDRVEVIPVDAGVALLEVGVVGDPEHAGRSVGAVFDALERAGSGLDDASLAVARHQAALPHAASLSDADGRASTLAGFALDGLARK